ncbi:hypothetical protein SLEP1_g9717 [Rubroshorea leprosula]|uniref:Uncharacterized protein n=1 Tax=Rubroshorea leprosula TaxID=152421 RepID=A0AAV5I5S4_9ROSI|nr:hypothetical protein SLEP1_g9717 [Rubroshorea leprosula]
MIKFRALCIRGTRSRVHGVCHVPRFGFWGVTLDLLTALMTIMSSSSSSSRSISGHVA